MVELRVATLKNFKSLLFKIKPFMTFIQSLLPGRFHSKINWLLLGGFSSLSTVFATS
jgi:hypothetical protein